MDSYPLVKKILLVTALAFGLYLITLGNDAEELETLNIFGWLIVGYIIASSLIKQIKK